MTQVVPRRPVGIVVVTHNSAAVLPGCLASLPEGSDGCEVSDVVVVDNASRDGSVEIAANARWPGVRVRALPTGRNDGYAAAINVGVRALRESDRPPGAVLVLNPDARLRPGSLAAMLGPVGEHGMVYPRMIDLDGTLSWSVRREPSLVSAAAEAFVGGPRSGRFGEVVRDPEVYERGGPVSWATGAAVLLSAELIADLGDWDESFLLYSEETEYALRAADRGWTPWYEPTAVVAHKGGESNVNPMLWSLLAVNRVRLYRRRHGELPGRAFHALVAAGELVRAACGRPTSRAAATALVRPSRRVASLS